MIRKIILLVLLLANLSGYANNCIDSVPLKVLILGNSITYHGAKASVGWSGNWGMAASAAGKDYVHLLESRIKKARPDAIIKFGNIAGSFERQFWKYNPDAFKEYSRLNADLIILEIGENINDSLAVKNLLATHLLAFVHELSANKDLKVCLAGSFWPNRNIDRILKTTCAQNNWVYVDLQGLYQDRAKNTAINQYSDKGVGRHPSDMGMENIANRIWDKIAYLFK